MGRLMLVLFVGLLAETCLAQQPKLGPFTKIQEGVRALKTPFPADNASKAELTELWGKMKLSTELLVALSESKTKPPPREYQQELELTRLALDHAKNPDLTTRRRVELCNSIVFDLSAKAKFASANAADPYLSVDVTVRTRSGMREVKGLEVWYVPSALKDVSERHRRFDRVSSPTQQAVVPGYYLMWTKDVARATESDKQQVTLGDDGKLMRTIDLPAPK